MTEAQADTETEVDQQGSQSTSPPPAGSEDGSDRSTDPARGEPTGEDTEPGIIVAETDDAAGDASSEPPDISDIIGLEDPATSIDQPPGKAPPSSPSGGATSGAAPQTGPPPTSEPPGAAPAKAEIDPSTTADVPGPPPPADDTPPPPPPPPADDAPPPAPSPTLEAQLTIEALPASAGAMQAAMPPAEPATATEPPLQPPAGGTPPPPPGLGSVTPQPLPDATAEAEPPPAGDAAGLAPPATPGGLATTAEIPASPSAAASRPPEPAPTGDYVVGARAGGGAAPGVSVDPDPTGIVPSVAFTTATAAARAERTGRRPLRALMTVLAAAAVVLVLLVAAWAIDGIRTEGEVARGTVLGTTPVGGLDGGELDDILAQLDNELAMTALEVNVEAESVLTDPATLGALLDRELLRDRAMEARRGGFPALRPFTWAASFFTEEEIALVYTVDPATTTEAIDAVLTDVVDEPAEPELDLTGAEVTVTPGRMGSQLSIDQIVELLPAALEAGAPYEITLDARPAAPELTDEEVQAVADEISEATATSVVFQVLDDNIELEPAEIREWVSLDPSGSEPTWQIDEEAALADLKERFPGLGSQDQQASFSVVDGAPIIVPASETVVCCAPDSVATIRDGLLAGPPPPEAGADGEGESDTEEPALPVITLEPEVVGADEGVAELESLGIVEEVSSFTTNHDCCANRVTNIHRFADLIRGVIIRPGEDLSLNGYVGRRTVENGFVADGAIVNGVLEPQVGGGVSQFATTFFNAAFFAGLDFNEYQSHSLYISRYPRGREATISFPKPDLSVKNTTDYGILVWPTYTDTSITITFYSTEHIEVEALPVVETSRDQCAVATTPRVRTYPDGSTVEDSVFALYRPGEGFDCAGNSTRPEEPNGPTAIPDQQPQPLPEAGQPQTPADSSAPDS